MLINENYTHTHTHTYLLINLKARLRPHSSIAMLSELSSIDHVDVSTLSFLRCIFHVNKYQRSTTCSKALSHWQCAHTTHSLTPERAQRNDASKRNITRQNARTPTKIKDIINKIFIFSHRARCERCDASVERSHLLLLMHHWWAIVISFGVMAVGLQSDASAGICFIRLCSVVRLVCLCGDFSTRDYRGRRAVRSDIALLTGIIVRRRRFAVFVNKPSVFIALWCIGRDRRICARMRRNIRIIPTHNWMTRCDSVCGCGCIRIRGTHLLNSYKMPLPVH